MKVFFQARRIDISEYEKNFMANRMYGLNKFFTPHAHAYVDIERTNASHHGHDLYYVSIRITEPGAAYFTEEYRENVRKSFDHAYGEMFRIVSKDRSRSRNIARKAGQRIKNLFKRI